MFLYIGLIFFGFALLIKGADFLVDGASEIAKKFHIPEIVIGMTIVSIGTSMPELVVSVTSAVEGHSGIAIGNIIGSNIVNLFIILGICSVIRPLLFKKQTKFIEIPITTFATIFLFYVCNNGNGNIITKEEGIILLLFCAMFIIYNITMAKRGEKFEKTDMEVSLIIDNNKISIVKSVLYIVLGIVGLKIGGDLVVNNSIISATLLGVSEKLISLTVVAISTSLPELITSINATLKNETDMAVRKCARFSNF